MAPGFILLFGILLLSFPAAPVAANPFMGSQGQPSIAPVQAGGQTQHSLVQGQLELRQKLAGYLSEWKDGRSASLLLVIVGIAFAYGILHALGPGHRKTVVFSIYIARKAPWWEPIASSLALAGLHGGAAILLLFLFRGVSGAVSAATDSIATIMEGSAYCILIVMAVILLARAVLDLAKGQSRSNDGMSLGTLILTGIYPCPGAILVLVLSLSLDIVDIGIVAVLAMSLGMSIPILAFAYLGWFGRSGLLRRFKSREKDIRKVGTWFEIAGFGILLVFSVYIALPFISSITGLIF
jgi:ABC-type nickel/cobalt efflux system permease component RcnA